MELKNEVMLITYADSLGKNLAELGDILQQHFDGAVGGLHILPFFPSSADRGFAPMTYRKVDPAFGTWEDMRSLAARYYTMYDFMINHISRQSEYFQDYLARCDDSAYKDLFIDYDDFWPAGHPTQQDIDIIYKRKPRAPYVEPRFADGRPRKIWCTFDEEQIDLNVDSPVTKRWIRENLEFLAKQGAAIIRLDAFAYATKKPGTDCFFVEPEVWALLQECADILKPAGCVMLPEIHEHYTMQLKVAGHGYYVYDFALPMLLLHALYTGEAGRLRHWLDICPRRQFTTLDTHDGIGLVDVRDLLSDEEIELTRERLYAQGGNVKKVYSTTAYNNLDIYQINCTYYSALGENDDAYLLARAIQFFTPGIPQVYYVGMLAGANDIELVGKTKTGRDINRHYYTKQEVAQEMERPVVQKLRALMRLRNIHPAFGGNLEITEPAQGQLELRWCNDAHQACLWADFAAKEFTINCTGSWPGLQPVVL